MAYSFTTQDVGYLRSPDGVSALASCAELAFTDASHIKDIAFVRRNVPAEHAAAVVETIRLRRKAPSKVEDSESWLLTDDSLQQASPSLVARHRAGRLAGRDIHDVTCSIGADLVELAKTARRCIGSDIDLVRLAMARHNVTVSGGSPLIVCADALAPVTRDTVIVVDPARRDQGGKRLWRAADFVPPLDDLTRVYAGRDLVIKSAPGMDFTGWVGEVELVSLDGRVREACLWSPGLATGSRRASVLRSDGRYWTVTDQDADEVPVAKPGEWIIDPDGAVVRAGLVRHYAAKHGLWQLDERIAYLTGDNPPPGVRAFRIIESGAYREKALKTLLRRFEVGRLEVLVRGLDVDPDALRKRLKPQGDTEATLVLARIGRSAAAFLCRAERVEA